MTEIHCKLLGIIEFLIQQVTKSTTHYYFTGKLDKDSLLFQTTPSFPMLWHQLGVLHFNLILALTTRRWHRPQTSRAQSYKTASTSDTSQKGVSRLPTLLPGQLQIWVLLRPHLKFNNWLNKQTKCRKALYLQKRVLLWRIQTRNRSIEAMPGERLGEGWVQKSNTLARSTTLPANQPVYQPGSSPKSCHSGVGIKVPLHGHGWLDHWLGGTQTCPFHWDVCLGGGAGGIENPTFKPSEPLPWS